MHAGSRTMVVSLPRCDHHTARGPTPPSSVVCLCFRICPFELRSFFVVSATVQDFKWAVRLLMRELPSAPLYPVDRPGLEANDLDFEILLGEFSRDVSRELRSRTGSSRLRRLLG